LVDARGHAFEKALEQMVMGIHPSWIDHAIARIQHLFAGQWLQVPHRFNDTIGDSKITAVARIAPGECTGVAS
jgi:hypothetical protein